MNENSTILSRIPLFSGLSDKERNDVWSIATEKRFAKGETVFSEGDPGDGFYVVAGGRIKISKVSPDGKEQILHIFGPPEPFGEVAVFAGENFPAGATAIEKSRLLFFPRAGFTGLIERNPSLAMNMLAVLSYRLRQFTVQVENLSLKEVPARLAGYLTLLSEEQDGRPEVTLPITKGQLAGLLGTIPETLSRIFAKMSDNGLITVSGKAITILDPDGLAHLAGNLARLE